MSGAYSATDWLRSDQVAKCVSLGRFHFEIYLTDLKNCYSRDVNFNSMSVYINLLKPTGHVMHQKFNIQQLYVLSTLYLWVLYLSENKQRLVPLIS